MTDTPGVIETASFGEARPPWVAPLIGALSSLWRVGRLVIVDPAGRSLAVGPGSSQAVVWRIRKWRAFSRMLKRGDIGFADVTMAKSSRVGLGQLAQLTSCNN